MKRIIIIALISICVVISSGCKGQIEKDVTINETSKITNEEILNIIETASKKVGCVYHLGGIEGCKVNREPIKIKGEEEEDYYELGSSIDTFDKLNEYLEDIFVEESIQNLIRELSIEKYKGKLYMENLDIVSGYYWDEVKDISIKYKDNTAVVSLNVEATVEDEYATISLQFVYDKINGWRLNLQEPTKLY